MRDDGVDVLLRERGGARERGKNGKMPIETTRFFSVRMASSIIFAAAALDRGSVLVRQLREPDCGSNSTARTDAHFQQERV